MSKSYTVVQGDHISRIAEKFHFFDHTIIWDHANNADLRNKRGNRHVLFPGDVVFIPDKTERKETRPTTKVHKFRVKRDKLYLLASVAPQRDDPPANPVLKLKVEAAEKTQNGDTTAMRIGRADTEGQLTYDVLNVDVRLKVGYLDPVEEVTGQQARLNNLGYGAGPVGEVDDERFRSAVEEFQCDNSLPVTGVVDADTRNKLKELHGC